MTIHAIEFHDAGRWWPVETYPTAAAAREAVRQLWPIPVRYTPYTFSAGN